MQYIFFDVDGVLVRGYHARPELRICWDEDLAKDFGIDRKRFSEEFIFGPFSREVIVGKKSLKDALAEMLPRLGCKALPEDFIKYWLKKDSNLNHALLDKIATLKKSSQVRLFIATNQAHERAAYLMNQMGLGTLFEDIFYSARVGAIKTDRAYFEHVSEKLRLPSDPKPVFFDDTPAVVSAAKAFGWDAFEFVDVSSLDQSPVVRSLLTAKPPSQQLGHPA